MWRLTILSALLAVTLSASIDQILGNWTTVVSSPDRTIPYCIQYSIAKPEHKTQCTCVDGKASNYMQIGIYNDPKVESVPLSVVDSPNEVMGLLNINCTCAGKELQRFVARRVNNNYIVLYLMTHNYNYTEKDQNNAYLMAKTIPTEAQLMKDVENIEEFHNRTGGAVCTQEYKEMYFN